MARPSSVDSEAVIAAVRSGTIAAEVGRQFGITRVRVNQILKEKAPELLANKTRTVKKSDAVLVNRRRSAAVVATEKALQKATTKKAAAEALGLTVSGLNARLRRFAITDTLTRSSRDERQKNETIKALAEHSSKQDAAKALKLTPSGLDSRMKRWGLEG